jgi:hypothetical protein
MFRSSLGVLGLLVALAVLPPSVRAQEATHVVIRYFKCNPEAVAIRMFQQTRSVAAEMVEEGKFLDYRLFRHNWGDDWNVVDEFTISGLSGYFANYSEMGRRIDEYLEGTDEDDEFPPFNEVCTEHKDNIYRLVQPPSGG